MSKFLIIDGNSLFHRCYHGVKELTNKYGVHTQAIFGFLNIYLSLNKKYNPTHIAVAFDRSEPTFRHEIYPEYKGNREPMPNDFAEQLPYLKNILSNLGIKIIDCPRFEADDIIGTISKKCEDINMECLAVSGDKDIAQLISDKVTVIMLKNREQLFFDKEKFISEEGYNPINIIDFKAIAGDSSDNYKGIKGVGEKTIKPLIQQYGTVENIYKNLDNIKLTPRFLKLFKENQEQALFCKNLATISRNAPIDTDISNYEYTGIKNPKDLLDILEYLEMKTFIKKFGLDDDVTSIKDVENVSIEPIILYDDFSTISNQVDYIIKNDTLYINDNKNIYESSNPSVIINFLESDIYKRTIFSKEHYMFTNNIKNIISDAEINGYLLDTSSKEYTVKSLCNQYRVDYFEHLNEYADIYSLPMLSDTLLENISKLEMNELKNLELELSKVLADMEKIGIKVDIATVKEYQFKLEDILVDLQDKIYLQANKEFKILSPKQLGEVLFEDLQLPPSKRTKTGYSTDNDVLENLKDSHPIIQLIIDYRFYHKLKSTYLDGLLKTVANDGRIHTIFRQTETRTGRLSSAEPNLQNIPIRNDFAKNIRKFFITDDDKILIDADYNQIELRLTAIMSNDTNMIDNFLSNNDIHTATAMRIFHKSKDEITPQMRGVAKSINFGLIYGMGASKLSREINISKEDAKIYIDNYFKMYPSIRTFMDKTIQDCKQHGYVKTILNRIRYIPEINSSNKKIQANGERIAMNTPIQGSSADIIKLAMVKVYNRLKDENLNAKLILQVHDELLIESHKDCAEIVAKIVKEEMENVMSLSVPLTVEVNIGRSWFDAH